MMNETLGRCAGSLRTGRGRRRASAKIRQGYPASTYTTIAIAPQKTAAAIGPLLEVESEVVLAPDVENRRPPRRDRSGEALDLGARVEPHEALEERVADLPLRRQHVPALRQRDEH